MSRAAFALIALVPLLAACGGGGGVQSAASKPAPARTAPTRTAPAHPAPKTLARPPAHQPPPPARRQMLPGLEGVIGATREGLERQFGAPRLDVYEGDARKLQFAGRACVLDVYLYPSAPGREPEATYVEARRASDAQNVDDVACINALRHRQ